MIDFRFSSRLEYLYLEIGSNSTNTQEITLSCDFNYKYENHIKLIKEDISHGQVQIVFKVVKRWLMG